MTNIRVPLLDSSGKIRSRYVPDPTPEGVAAALTAPDSPAMAAVLAAVEVDAGGVTAALDPVDPDVAVFTIPDAPA